MYTYMKLCNRYIKAHLFLGGCDMVTQCITQSQKKPKPTPTEKAKQGYGKAFHSVILINDKPPQQGFATPTIIITTNHKKPLELSAERLRA